MGPSPLITNWENVPQLELMEAFLQRKLLSQVITLPCDKLTQNNCQYNPLAITDDVQVLKDWHHYVVKEEIEDIEDNYLQIYIHIL